MGRKRHEERVAGGEKRRDLLERYLAMERHVVEATLVGQRDEPVAEGAVPDQREREAVSCYPGRFDHAGERLCDTERSGERDQEAALFDPEPCSHRPAAIDE